MRWLINDACGQMFADFVANNIIHDGKEIVFEIRSFDVIL